MVQGLVALRHVESSQTRDWTNVACIGRQILIQCTTRKALVPCFYLQFRLWIKILRTTYYSFLVTLTCRNQGRRGNDGKRIKLPVCWAGSFPCPLTAFTPPPTASLNQIQHQRGVLELWGMGQAEEGTWDVHRWVEIISWTHCLGIISKHRNEANSDTVSGPGHRSKVKLLIQSPNSIFPQTF